MNQYSARLRAKEEQVWLWRPEGISSWPPTPPAPSAPRDPAWKEPVLLSRTCQTPGAGQSDEPQLTVSTFNNI